MRDETDARLPKAARFALTAIADQIEALTRQIETRAGDRSPRQSVTRTRGGWPRSPVSARSPRLPIKALVPDPGGFKSGRHFAAWLGVDAEVAFERRQGAVGRNIEDGQSRSFAPCWWSVRPRSCGMRGATQRRRIGSPLFWRGGPSRSWPSRSPTRWRASSGRFSPRAGHTGDLEAANSTAGA